MRLCTVRCVACGQCPQERRRALGGLRVLVQAEEESWSAMLAATDTCCCAVLQWPTSLPPSKSSRGATAGSTA